MAAAPGGRAGLISVFARHPNAANLTMVLMLLFGAYGIAKLNTQFFPTVETKRITVSVAWPGASAEDVSAGILAAIEPEVRFIDGVDETRSYAREGAATIMLEFVPGADMQKALSDVQTAVSQVTTLPEEAETPEVSRSQYFDTVGKISLSGPFSEAALRVFAKRMRDELIARDIDRVTFTGMRDQEIRVDVPERELRRLGMTVGDVSERIRSNSRNLPSGSLEGAVEKQLRAETAADTPGGIGAIEVKTLPGGERVLLKDVADIRPAFEDGQERGLRDGERAIELIVWRSASADTLQTDAIVNRYLAGARGSYPATLRIAKYEVRADLVQQRVNLLVKNGLSGLILVVAVMYLFLNARIAFWVAAGIPVAMFATLGVMYVSGQTINMMSLFALIMTLGIIVDDAIVVGEHTATRFEAGDGAVMAAERGAGRMIAPVLAASLTTMASFSPIFLVGGVIGQMMAALPLVVIAVLTASLVECFLVLPGHLAHSLSRSRAVRWSYWRQILLAATLTAVAFAAIHLVPADADAADAALAVASAEMAGAAASGLSGVLAAIPAALSLASLGVLAAAARLAELAAGAPPPALAVAVPAAALTVATLVEALLWRRARRRARLGAPDESAFRRGFDRGFARFRDGPFRAAVGLAYTFRYVFLALCLSVLMVTTWGLVGGGRVGFSFFPSPEAENIRAVIEFNAGLPEERAVEALARIEGAIAAAERELTGGSQRLVSASFATQGRSGNNRGTNLAEIDVELVPSEQRSVRTPEIVRAWRAQVPDIAGVKSVAIYERRGGPPGRDVDLRLHDAPPLDLKLAALEVADLLTGFPGVSGVADDLPYGKPEIVMTLTPRGAALGFTVEEVGRQLRNSFEGAIARRIARGDEEIAIRVRKLMSAQGNAQLRQFELKSPAGDFVPLTEVVRLTERQGFSVIQRRQGRETVSVTADVDNKVASPGEIVSALRDSPQLADIAARHGVGVSFSGREEERRESFADLRLGAIVAGSVIYIVLAWVFASYARPAAVMLIIPFGIVGAVLGHYLLDFRLTILSYIGLLGLSGILVNDSIILVARMDERLAAGEELGAAAVGASCDRLRAVLLTSLTTVGGLLPLLFETSLQAQFLIPMAITIVFGLGFATLVVLFLVPVLAGIGGDIATAFRFLYGRRRGTLQPGE